MNTKKMDIKMIHEFCAECVVKAEHNFYLPYLSACKFLNKTIVPWKEYRVGAKVTEANLFWVMVKVYLHSTLRNISSVYDGEHGMQMLKGSLSYVYCNYVLPALWSYDVGVSITKEELWSELMVNMNYQKFALLDFDKKVCLSKVLQEPYRGSELIYVLYYLNELVIAQGVHPSEDLLQRTQEVVNRVEFQLSKERTEIERWEIREEKDYFETLIPIIERFKAVLGMKELPTEYAKETYLPFSKKLGVKDRRWYLEKIQKGELFI